MSEGPMLFSDYGSEEILGVEFRIVSSLGDIKAGVYKTRKITVATIQDGQWFCIVDSLIQNGYHDCDTKAVQAAIDLIDRR